MNLFPTTVASVPFVVDTTYFSDGFNLETREEVSKDIWSVDPESIIHAQDPIGVGLSNDLPSDSEEMCNAVALVLGEDISAMAVETDDVASGVLPLCFGALEGSHHSGYLIKS